VTLLEQIAQQRTNEVVYTSISVTIEKIAADAARDILRDPIFKATLKAAAMMSVKRATRDLLRSSARRRKRAKR